MAGLGKSILKNAAPGLVMGIGMEYGVGAAMCQMLSTNPYEDCMKLNECYKIPQESINNCNIICSKDEDKPLCLKKCKNDAITDCSIEFSCDTKTKDNLQDECFKKAVTGQSMGGDKLIMGTVPDLAIGAAQTYVKAAGKGTTKGFGKAATKTATEAGKKAGKKAAKKVLAKAGRKAGKEAAKKAAQKGLSKAAQKAASKAASKIAVKAAQKAATKAATKAASKAFAKMMAKLLLKAAFKAMMKGLAALSTPMLIFDIFSMGLDMWDPSGWDLTVDRVMIKETRDMYLEIHLQNYDNKNYFSDLYRVERDDIKTQVEEQKLITNQNNTRENSLKLSDLRRQLEDAQIKLLKHKWKGKDRPVKHGGPVVYPIIATPDYPEYNLSNSVSGIFTDPALSDKYELYKTEYLEKNGYTMDPTKAEIELSDEDLLEAQKEELNINENQIEKNNKLIQRYKELGDTKQLAILEQQNKDLLEENQQMENITQLMKSDINQPQSKSSYLKYVIIVVGIAVAIALYIKFK